MMTVDESLMLVESSGMLSGPDVVLSAEVRRLRFELEQERKRLDWALLHGASYHKETLTDYLPEEMASHKTDNPRATIDKLMERQS